MTTTNITDAYATHKETVPHSPNDCGRSLTFITKCPLILTLILTLLKKSPWMHSYMVQSFQVSISF